MQREVCEYLKPKMSFEKLDEIATGVSDNEAAEILKTEQQNLFNHILDQGKKRAKLNPPISDSFVYWKILFATEPKTEPFIV